MIKIPEEHGSAGSCLIPSSIYRQYFRALFSAPLQFFLFKTQSFLCCVDRHVCAIANCTPENTEGGPYTKSWYGYVHTNLGMIFVLDEKLRYM